jgi:hypothetical protein
MKLQNGFEWSSTPPVGKIMAWVEQEVLDKLPPPDWKQQVGKGGYFLIEYNDTPINRVALLVAGYRAPT